MSRSLVSLLAVVVLALAAAAATPSAQAVTPGAGPQDRMAPGPPHETNLVVGQRPPSSFALPTLDGEILDLAAQRGQRPIMLLFFRGTW